MIQTFIKWFACILCHRLNGEEENIIGVPAHEPVPKTSRRTNRKPTGCRNTTKCYMEGQRIRNLCNRLNGEEENIIGVPAHEPVLKTSWRTNRKPTGCRDTTKCYMEGQRIRHIIGINHICTATYDRSQDAIVYKNVLFTYEYWVVAEGKTCVASKNA
jgi:hypothetical protein